MDVKTDSDKDTNMNFIFPLLLFIFALRSEDVEAIVRSDGRMDDVGGQAGGETFVAERQERVFRQFSIKLFPEERGLVEVGLQTVETPHRRLK